jgi:hypothetical protein
MSRQTAEIELTQEDFEYLKNRSPQDVAHVLADSSALYWAESTHLKLQSGEFSLEGREYMAEWIDGPLDRIQKGFPRARKHCVMKAPQMGESTAQAIDSCHGMKNGRYPLGVLHLLPTKETVQEFGKTKYGPILTKNRESIGKYVKSGGKGTDSASLKQIGNAFLYLRSASLSEDDTGDSLRSNQLSSISVDKVVLDEIELMSIEAIALAEGRMDASDVRMTVYIGNPGGEDSGVDLVFKQTDQRHWFRRCTCVAGDLSAWTCAERDFPGCVREYPDSEERALKGLPRGFIACKKCGKPVPMYAGPGTGLWIPEKPSVVDFDGYQLSHLSSNKHDPLEILKKFENPPFGDIAGVYRMELGLPFSAAEDKMRVNVVLQNCGTYIQAQNHPGPCCMGVDVGLIKHVVIGFKTGIDKFEIIRVAKCRSFDEITDLRRKYGVKSTVVDIRPYEDEARKFQKFEKSEGNRVYLCQYVESPLREYDFNDNTGVVKTYRTGIFDNSHRMMANGNIVLPRKDSAMQEFAEQFCNCEKFPDKDRNGAQVMRYRPCGNQQQGEHYRNSTNYFLLAAMKGRIVSRSGKQTLQTACVNERPLYGE